MRGYHSPWGWAAVILVTVTYAHVILELAVAVLAVAFAARVIMSPAPGVIARRVRRQIHEQRTGRVAQPPATVDSRVVDRSLDRPQTSRGERR
jgi:hypothetical protein